METGDVKQKVILILAASPKELGSIQDNPEKNAIRDVLAKTNKYDEFRIEISSGVTTNQIIDELTTYQPYIVHVIGHANATGICVVDSNENAELLNNNDLDTIFSALSNKTECVILNACHSNTQAKIIHRYVDIGHGSKQPLFR